MAPRQLPPLHDMEDYHLPNLVTGVLENVLDNDIPDEPLDDFSSESTLSTIDFTANIEICEVNDDDHSSIASTNDSQGGTEANAAGDSFGSTDDLRECSCVRPGQISQWICDYLAQEEEAFAQAEVPWCVCAISSNQSQTTHWFIGNINEDSQSTDLESQVSNSPVEDEYESPAGYKHSECIDLADIYAQQLAACEDLREIHSLQSGMIVVAPASVIPTASEAISGTLPDTPGQEASTSGLSVAEQPTLVIDHKEELPSYENALLSVEEMATVTDLEDLPVQDDEQDSPFVNEQPAAFTNLEDVPVQEDQEVSSFVVEQPAGVTDDVTDGVEGPPLIDGDEGALDLQIGHDSSYNMDEAGPSQSSHMPRSILCSSGMDTSEGGERVAEDGQTTPPRSRHTEFNSPEPILPPSRRSPDRYLPYRRPDGKDNCRNINPF